MSWLVITLGLWLVYLLSGCVFVCLIDRWAAWCDVQHECHGRCSRPDIRWCAGTEITVAVVTGSAGESPHYRPWVYDTSLSVVHWFHNETQPVSSVIQSCCCWCCCYWWCWWWWWWCYYSQLFAWLFVSVSDRLTDWEVIVVNCVCLSTETSTLTVMTSHWSSNQSCLRVFLQ